MVLMIPTRGSHRLEDEYVVVQVVVGLSDAALAQVWTFAELDELEAERLEQLEHEIVELGMESTGRLLVAVLFQLLLLLLLLVQWRIHVLLML